jgi:hypothetical protein
MKNLSLLILGLALTLSACKKENGDDADNNNGGGGTPSCLLTNATDSSSEKIEYMYSGNIPSKIAHYSSSSLPNWNLDYTMEFNYNPASQLTQLVNRSTDYKSVYNLIYESGKIKTMETYDSSTSGPNNYNFSIAYTYNQNNQISNWKAFDKDEPSVNFAEVDFSYDANGGIKEMLFKEPNDMGQMVPTEKYVFTSDNYKLADPYFMSNLLDIEFFYLVFMQPGLKQIKSYEYLYFDEDTQTWETDESVSFINTFDSNGNLTKISDGSSSFYFNWTCK